jgi:dihydropteroate synthase-like protein
MKEHLIFVTGRLAEPRLRRVLEGMGDTPWTWEVRQIGVKVAALLTPEILRRRIGALEGASRVVLPGRFQGDLDILSREFGVRFERGPDELKDLPRYLGHSGPKRALTAQDTRIFAEIVEAPRLDVPAILARAHRLASQGADVIDLGCLPGVPFPHLEDTVQALLAEGFPVSIDSGDPDELRRGGRAGAAYLLSLNGGTIDLAFETEAVPVVIPEQHGNLNGLIAACERLKRAGKPFLADPILDPIHVGFTESICRYQAARERMPDAEMLMGVGNLTELTDADTTGITMLLMAICSELRIRNVLVVQVSPHCRNAVREAEIARRILYAARDEDGPPQWIDSGLLCLRDRRPFPDSPAEIAETAAAISDPNFRIQAAEDGVHIYNRDGHHISADPFELFSQLKLGSDVGHAFYLGVELARAQIAYQLGKRYSQDEALGWGCAVEAAPRQRIHFQAAGPTVKSRREGD